VGGGITVRFTRLAATILICTHSAYAQSVFDNPNSASAEAMAKAGWRIDSGEAQHEASSTTCPAELPGFEPLIFTGPVEPNVLGTCTYKDSAGGGDTGIQVRRYIRDVGESREAIQNDRSLMEPRGAGAPFMAVRFQPITTRDGNRGGRVVITKMRGGLLIDCFGEGDSLEKASSKISLFCGN
jgi:hypothetical protein